MSDLVKKAPTDVALEEIRIGIANGDVPADLYSEIPCTVGYSYIRFEVSGNIVPCCIAKHRVGDVKKSDWREIWHSGAYDAFRRKMTRIHRDRFHLVDPEWTFCQQCSHVTLNRTNAELLVKGAEKDK
jgi:radical SAM protein with 4Fe4S-binding SPASM domain